MVRLLARQLRICTRNELSLELDGLNLAGQLLLPGNPKACIFTDCF